MPAIEILCIGDEAETRHFSLRADSPYNHRSRMVGFGRAGVYLVWDSYAHGTYRVHGCRILPDAPLEIVTISNDDEAWENKAAICRDRDGGLWTVWVRWQDVMWRESVIHQKFSLRGARYDGRSWEALHGPDGTPDIAPLNYGLLTDFACTPQLGHMGRRLHPMLKGAEDNGVWLLYEVKANAADGTRDSKGRLLGHRCADGEWSGPHNVAEGRVFYELPHNDTVGDELCLVSRDIETDELHLENVPLSTSLPIVPEDRRTVDLSEWQEVRLPIHDTHDDERPRNQLPGEERARYQLCWGDFHVHSSVSPEMDGDPDELAFYARDKACIDALTISDNDNFWNRFVRKNQRWLKDYEWDCILGNARVVNEPGRFAMFPGYELTITGPDKWDRHHRSVMADDDEMQMDRLHHECFEEYVRGERNTHKDIDACIAWAKEKGYLALPHPHHGVWKIVDVNVEWDVDICAAWMRNMELYDIFFTYLNDSHKFGFTGSSDAHYRNPGYGGALTGIWSERLDRASILEALRARRCYATAGQRILMEFSINDCMMGGELTVSDDPVLRWHVAGEDQEYILRIHRDGRLMHDERFVGETHGELQESRLLEYRPGRHYYYLEVLSPEPIPDYPSNVAHALGARAWSSPIWLETEVSR